MVKNPPAIQETQVQSLGREDSLEKEMATTAVFLPAKFQGWRSVADCSSWGHKRVGNDLVSKQQQTLPVSSISVSQFELLINTQVHENIQLWKSQYSCHYYFLLINHLNTISFNFLHNNDHFLKLSFAFIYFLVVSLQFNENST